MLLGCGDSDDAADGLEVDLQKGDVIVLPAGTGHCNLQSTNDYRYIGVYPEVRGFHQKHGKGLIWFDRVHRNGGTNSER